MFLQINWDMSNDEILDKIKDFIKRSKTNNNKLAQFQFNNNAKSNFISILADDIAEYTAYHSMCSFLQFINPNFTKNANYLLTKYINKLNSRKDIYLKIKEFNQLFTLDGHEQKFISTIIKGYERKGINNDIQKIQKIRKDIMQLETKIINFISDKQNSIQIHEKDIGGMAQTLTDSFSIQNKKYMLPMTYSNYIKCMKYINNDKIRLEINKMFNIRFITVLDDVSKLLIFRQEFAKELGYNNYSDYINNTQLAETSENIKKFLTSNDHVLDAKYYEELKMIKTVKQNNDLYDTDVDHLISVCKNNYGLDDAKLKEYFPLDHIKKVILQTYENIFDLKFEKITDNAIIWHKSVELYAIFNMKNKVVGYFYLDLIKRKNKPSNSICFSLQSPSYYPFNSGKYQTPVNSIMFSFNKLLCFNEVVHFFHEFSHVIQCVFNKNRYSLFSGTNVQKDYVQIPAMVLEYVCWEKRFIKKASCHYKTGDQLHDNIIDKLIQMRDIDIGINFKRNILLSTYDQMIHSHDELIELCKNAKSKKDLPTVFFKIHKILANKIIPEINIASSLFPISLFKNFCNAPTQYYIYMWSKICAADIYHNITKNRLSLKKIIGEQLYTSSDPLTTLVTLLDRKPSIEGLLKIHNIKDHIIETKKINKKYKIEQRTCDTDCNKYTEIEFTEDTESLARYKHIFLNKNTDKK